MSHVTNATPISDPAPAGPSMAISHLFTKYPYEPPTPFPNQSSNFVNPNTKEKSSESMIAP